ncbi:hypothetical protein POTG_02062 [Paenibacillus sp. oral taxon 786 str. D14]|uniref:hypothetical protein n=1 Tax=Paenibacillus sp. oral taxon 786 TaxID=652715 RepID=UPI0001AFCEBB|nr:hypothetical protein [Paenibacillus sp. oral taxon 786]EES73310.1 hypothetical protein POTG_02062 [Paenibacillus sp. oral taxon 786 str. D14]
MSKSKTYFDALISLRDEVNSAFTLLNRKLSELDRQINAIYHELEKCELDADSGFAAAVLLQDVLRRRRVVKDEIARMDPLFKFLSDHTGGLIDNYQKRVEKSEEIRRNLNVTLSLEEVITL